MFLADLPAHDRPRHFHHQRRRARDRPAARALIRHLLTATGDQRQELLRGQDPSRPAVFGWRSRPTLTAPSIAASTASAIPGHFAPAHLGGDTNVKISTYQE